MAAGGKYLVAHFRRSDAVAQGCLYPLFDPWQHLRPDHNPQIFVLWRIGLDPTPKDAPFEWPQIPDAENVLR